MEWCKRLCCPINWTTVSQEERTTIGASTECFPRFLLKRKTLLQIVFVLNILYNISDIVELSNISKYSDDTQLTDSSFSKFVAIIVILFIINLARTVLLFLAQYNWNKYKFSIMMIGISGIVTLYLQIFIMFAPIDSLVETKGDIIEKSGNYLIIMINMLYFYIQLFMPSIMLINSILFATDNLTSIFNDSGELKIINKVLVAIYVPVYTILFLIIYQIATSIIHISGFPQLYITLGVIVWLLYTLKVLSTLFQHPKKWYAETIINITLLIIVYILLSKLLGKDVVIMLIKTLLQMYISYLSISVATNDFIMYILMTFRNKDNTLLDSFIHDVKNTRTNTQTAIEFENLPASV